MSLIRKFAPLAGAVVALCLGTAAASAAPAYSTTSLNVRSGPGIHYRVVDTLHRGERVNIDYCRGSWCFVNKSGPDGWVSASYLSRGGYDAPRYRDRYDRYDRYDRWDNRYRGPRLPFTNYRPYGRYYDPSVCFGSNNARLCFD